MRRISSRIGSIKFTLIVSIMSVGILSQLASGITQYITTAENSRKELGNINEAVMQSVVSLASRGVDGGNKMILAKSNALSLYNSSKILYMKISGTSAGREKTSYSDAIPPQLIEYEFFAEDIDANKTKAAADSGKTGLIEDSMLFVVKLPLNTKNGGEVTAVFSAEKLRGLEWRVARDVGTMTLYILLAAFVLAIIIGRRVAGPIENISYQINEITNNSDLTARVETSNQHEIGQIARSFNSLIDNLQASMKDINSSAEHVLETANQLADTSSRISTGSIEQRKCSAETATAIDELSRSIGEVANKANEANKTSADTNQIASEGELITQDATNEMRKIADAVKSTTKQVLALDDDSREIGSIISLIKDIADQTNLLALNAAIEAARAGEQGRGFAVVADEVRNLAKRTNDATSEIADKIDSSQEKTANTVDSMQKGVALVENGEVLSNKAGEALSRINKGAQYTANMISGIATATQEQTVTSTEIARNIEAIAQTAEKYETIVSETRVTTKNLEELATSLKAMAGRFKV